MIQNPFKFLEAYGKEDKERFFGRERETAQLFNAVHASNLVLLYGGSGTGKSSLINCGLANQFHDTDWLPIFIRRGSDLNRSLRRELNRHAPRADWEDDTPVRHRIRDLYQQTYRPAYLIFDQFEELYILGSKEEQQHFHRTVAELLQAGLRCKMIISIREEYLAFLSEFEKMVPPLFDNRLRIEPMNDRNLIRVILGTCKYGGIQVVNRRETVGLILDNLRDQREGISLTNLQVYLDRLFKADLKRQEERGITHPEKVTFDVPLVESVGSVSNVLSEFLDEQLNGIEDGLRRRGVKQPDGLPLEVLFTLVTEDGTKRSREVQNIIDDMPPNRRLSSSDLEYCLSEFDRIRLLRKFAEE